MTDQTSRVALVTGSATGVGRECALQLAKRGFAVAVNYSRSRDAAMATAEDIERLGARVLVRQCDVSDDRGVRQMVADVESELGRLDVLVNNAGTTHFVDFSDLDGLTEEMWDRMLAVNLKGAFFCARAAAPLLRQAGGAAVVNVSSCAGVTGSGSSIAYAASKGALNTMTKSLARALAPDVRVNAVCPGPISTRWMEGRDEMMAQSMKRTPLGRPSTAREIASSVLYLALDATMTTGQCLVIDGGRTV